MRGGDIMKYLITFLVVLLALFVALGSLSNEAKAVPCENNGNNPHCPTPTLEPTVTPSFTPTPTICLDPAGNPCPTPTVVLP